MENASATRAIGELEQLMAERFSPLRRHVACLLRGFSSEQCPLHFNFLRIVVWLARNKTSN